MRKVCLQVGHWNIENITSEGLRSWRSASVLKSSTGASGERDWHWNEWMPRLRDKLIQAGVQVFIVDATYRPDTYNQEYDLWISGHYDGGGTGERCMVSPPNRDTVPAYLNEAAQREAERFCAIWKNVYPATVNLPNRDDFITAGMKDYYAFDYVGFDTPSVIIEHFNHTSAKGGQLKSNPDKVVEGDFKAIMEFLNLENGNNDCETKLSDCRDELDSCRELLSAKSKELSEELKKHNETLDNLKKQEADNTDLANQLKAARDENGALSREKQAMETKLKDCQSQHGKDLEGMEILKEEIKGLRAALAASQTAKIRAMSWWDIFKIKFGKGGEE